MQSLYVFIQGKRAGRITEGVHTHVLTYEPEYAHSPDAIPLSHSLPLRTEAIEHKRVTNYCWNLITENAAVLDSLGRVFRISNLNDPLSILSKIGMDTAGAIQFSTQPQLPPEESASEALSDAEIENEITTIRAMRTSFRNRISLAGYQPKTAYRRGSDGRWYHSTGSAASTHIFKPAPADEKNLDYIEHVMSVTAREMHISAVETDVLHFGDERVFVTTRYDRRADGDTVHRLHQEDFIQAIGRSRTAKYQSDGGPTLVDLIRFTRDNSPTDLQSLMRLVAFNVYSGNPDAHGKNYSYLILPEGHRLAPGYDLLSLLSYGEKYNTALAMSVGSAKHPAQVTDNNWIWVAKKANIDPHMVLDAVAYVRDNLPAAFERARNTVGVDLHEFDIIGDAFRPSHPPVP